MKAIVCPKHGSPDFLQLKEVAKPASKDDEVLINNCSTTCHAGDVKIRNYQVSFWQMIPFRLYLCIRAIENQRGRYWGWNWPGRLKK
jgi:NADPH:quinone reductase-like Zn-dependent oxidoreductase